MLAAGMAWLWQRQAVQQPAPAATVAALQADIADLRADLDRQGKAASAATAALAGRLAAVEQRPGSSGTGPAAAAALSKAVAEDARRTDALTQQVAHLASTVGQVSQRSEAAAHQLAVLSQQVAAQVQHQAASDERISALAAERAARATETKDAVASLRQALAAQQAATATLTRKLDALANASGQTSRLAEVQAARVALAAGRPLGDLPGAPPALTRFAAAAPPTEAALRLGFPEAARAALAASRPVVAGKPFLAQLWARAQGLVTIRQDNRVIVGNPASGTLATAQGRLDAGDLAGAVAALNALKGPAAAAMTPWRARAQSLLDARAALDAMETAR
ncbi:MAG: hypothetical protein KGL52_02790 [Rhodospirillales bacterium]|nr:hypothetical protein [Rhodospirillales bacterium]